MTRESGLLSAKAQENTPGDLFVHPAAHAFRGAGGDAFEAAEQSFYRKAERRFFHVTHTLATLTHSVLIALRVSSARSGASKVMP